MKIRLKFTKSGPLKFIGHLDIMRYFQKAFRRADIDVEYSQGFSPHQIVSFAAPLGVGLTSDSEYMDVQLLSSDTNEEMMKRINAVMAENIQIVNFQVLPDDSKNAMSIVAAADYMVSIKDGYDFMDKASLEDKFAKFYDRETIIINKKTKKSEMEVDIKALIYAVAFTEEDFHEKIKKAPAIEKNPTVAESYANGIKLYMQLATGSVNNLKPELVMEAFCKQEGIEFNPFAYQVHRMEVYADMGDETKKVLLPLDQLTNY